jgi:hypothetical protein
VAAGAADDPGAADASGQADTTGTGGTDTPGEAPPEAAAAAAADGQADDPAPAEAGGVANVQPGPSPPAQAATNSVRVSRNSSARATEVMRSLYSARSFHFRPKSCKNVVQQYFGRAILRQSGLPDPSRNN